MLEMVLSMLHTVISARSLECTICRFRSLELLKFQVSTEPRPLPGTYQMTFTSKPHLAWWSCCLHKPECCLWLWCVHFSTVCS